MKYFVFILILSIQSSSWAGYFEPYLKQRITYLDQYDQATDSPRLFEQLQNLLESQFTGTVLDRAKAMAGNVQALYDSEYSRIKDADRNHKYVTPGSLHVEMKSQNDTEYLEASFELIAFRLICLARAGSNFAMIGCFDKKSHVFFEEFSPDSRAIKSLSDSEQNAFWNLKESLFE